MSYGIVTVEALKRGGPALRDALNNQSYLQHPWQRVLYVQSTHRRATNINNAGTSPDAPLATLRQALAQSLDDDVIIVGPGHAETLSSSLTIPKANLSIIGCGVESQRPTFTVGTVTTHTITIGTAAVGLQWHKCRFVPGIDSLVAGFTLSAATSVLFQDCYFGEDTSIQALKWFDVQTLSTRCTWRRCQWEQLSAGAASAIDLGAVANSHLHVIECDIVGNYSVACLSIDVAATHLRIGENNLHNLNATSNDCINVGAVAASGYVYLNRCRNQTDADLGWITMGAGCLLSLFQNYGVNDNQETGVLIGTPSA